MNDSIFEMAEHLTNADSSLRARAAAKVYEQGRAMAEPAIEKWWSNTELAKLLLWPAPKVTVGLAVSRETFAKIYEANGAPQMARVPPDQDAEEFELHFSPDIFLDVLTSRDPAGGGAIARYLHKFGEGIQQVEFLCLNVDHATEILKESFAITPAYSHARDGADGTRVNFFLLPSTGAGKVLIELYEPAAEATRHYRRF